MQKKRDKNVISRKSKTWFVCEKLPLTGRFSHTTKKKRTQPAVLIVRHCINIQKLGHADLKSIGNFFQAAPVRVCDAPLNSTDPCLGNFGEFGKFFLENPARFLLFFISSARNIFILEIDSPPSMSK